MVWALPGYPGAVCIPEVFACDDIVNGYGLFVIVDVAIDMGNMLAPETTTGVPAVTEGVGPTCVGKTVTPPLVPV